MILSNVLFNIIYVDDVGEEAVAKDMRLNREIFTFGFSLIQMMLWLFYYSPIKHPRYDKSHLDVESEHPVLIQFKNSSKSHQIGVTFYMLIILLIFGAEVYESEIRDVKDLNEENVLLLAVKTLFTLSLYGSILPLLSMIQTISKVKDIDYLTKMVK